MNRRILALLAVLVMVLAACGDDGAESSTTAAGDGGTTVAGGDGDCLVGMSWNNYNEERWAKHDEPAIQAALEAGGCEYIQTDAGSSEEQQITDVENLIN